MKKIIPLVILSLFVSCVTVVKKPGHQRNRNNAKETASPAFVRSSSNSGESTKKFKYGKWVCIDKNLNEKFLIDARRVYPFSNGLARVYTYKYNYVNKSGKMISSRGFTGAYDFTGPATWARFSGKSHYSLIDKNGKIVSDRVFKKVDKFKPGIDVCAVYDNKKRMAFINTSGKLVIPFGKYTKKRAFYEGLCAVQKANGKWDIIDTKGKVVLQCKTDFYNDFSEGLFIARKNGLKGYLDRNGRVIIPYRYKVAGKFQNGFAKVILGGKKYGKSALIDKKGRVVYSTRKGEIIKAEINGLVMVCTNQRKFIIGWTNFKDQWVIKPIYHHPSTFEGGGKEYPYSSVHKGRKWTTGMIDTRGKIVIPVKYRNIIFHQYETYGVIHATDYARKKHFYTLDFKPIKPAGINIMQVRGKKKDPYLPFRTDKKKWGYISLDGKVVMKPVYEKTDVFREGLSWMKKKK